MLKFIKLINEDKYKNSKVKKKYLSKFFYIFFIVHDKRCKYLKISIINVEIFCYIVDY